MSTIYSAAGTFPLKIREAISTRFSGLIEYSATYLVEKGSMPAGFDIGAKLPTSIGTQVSVYPGARYNRSNDSPFDEMEITAYGHIFSTINRIVYGTENLVLSKTFQDTRSTQSTTTTYNWTVYEAWQCETATKQTVLPNTSTQYSDPPGSLGRKLIRRWVVGEVPASGRISLQIIWNEIRRDVQRTNFGAWDEVAVMKGYVPEVS